MNFQDWPDLSGANSFGSQPEFLLFDRLARHLKGNVKFGTQVCVNTICGQFRVDAVIEDLDSGRKVGIEVDGLHHLGLDHLIRDNWRDAILLGQDNFYAIYRVLSRDILATNREEFMQADWLYYLSCWNHFLFDEGELQRIQSFASKEAVAYRYNGWNPEFAKINYKLSEFDYGQPYPPGIVRRHTLDKTENLENYWLYVKMRNGGDLGALIDDWKTFAMAGFDAGEILNVASQMTPDETAGLPLKPRWDKTRMIPSYMLEFVNG